MTQEIASSIVNRERKVARRKDCAGHGCRYRITGQPIGSYIMGSLS